MVGLEELMLLNCGVEDSWGSLGIQGDQTVQSWNKPWIFIERTVYEVPKQRADSLEKTMILGKTEAKGERDVAGWDG